LHAAVRSILLFAENDGDGRNGPVIHLDDVSKTYGNLVALDRLTVDVHPGAVGLLGPNGAGKSTLIKMLLGLVRLSSGTAKIFGLDVESNSRGIRELVGYMPEDDCYFTTLKGVESVAYAGELAGLEGRTSLRRAHEILDYVGIAEERYREIQTYSTGMKQKIKLAQAIVHSPRLVLLDEPTSGMDPTGRERMLKLIRDLAKRKGVNVVVSTHILRDVEACCDSVVILGHGRLLRYDSLEVLKRPVDNSCHVYFDGDAEAFKRALAAAGLKTTALEADRIDLQGADGGMSASVFRCAVETGTAVRQLIRSRNSLEDIFLQAVREDRHADL
jgi:ABC-2 type transport system ATP-binding protein